MPPLFRFLRLAIRNLRRGGQLVLVALLCITFGIMALVAMTMLAKSIQSVVDVTPAQLIGGDISVGRKTGEYLLPEDVNQLQSLQRSGEISSYTLIAYNNTSITFRTPDSGEIHFIGIGMGVEPDKYPLAGSLTIGEPGSEGVRDLSLTPDISLTSLLRQVGDTVITRDVAEEYNLMVGDPIILSDLRLGIPLEGTVRGIAYDTPNHQGDKIYYSVETAQKLANGQRVVNTVIANTAQAEKVKETLDSSGWSVDWAAGRRDDNTANAWVLGLRGAGILGLLVGGTGVANTMQVLLRRRQREVAIWKTLGYHAGLLRLIFSLEAGLLGLAGSLLGAGFGVLVSTGLLEVFRRTSSLLYQWTFSPTQSLMGILIGTSTTVIFAFWAIAVASQARPMALLRNEPVDVADHGVGCQFAALGLLLAAPFTALASLVMESLIAGFGMLVFIAIGIAGLGGFFSGLLWLCTRLMPLRRFPLAHMAMNNLRRRGVAMVFAMIALFVGVLSLSLGLLVMQISERRSSGPAINIQGYNLNILAAAGKEAAIRQAVDAQKPEKVGVGYRTAVAGLTVVGNRGEPIPGMDAVLVGRSDPVDYVIRGAEWGSQPDGVYVYEGSHLETGSQVKAVFRDGTAKIFKVVGSYTINYRSDNLIPPTGLLMPAQTFTRGVRPDTVTYFIQVAPSQANRTAAELGASLPEATIVNLAAYAGRFMQSYRRLYVLPIVMAGLALLAGLLLVANSVSLAMLDRRYEIGILKTVGYSRRQVLTIFAVEYGLAALLATGAGVLAIEGFLSLLAIAAHLPVAALLLASPSLMLVAFCGVGLTLLTVYAVTREPTRVSPVVILNERN